MSIITSASGSACWRGLEYYKLNKVGNINMINDFEYESIVEGTDKYNVHLNLKKPRTSKCNCPHANGKMIICKHIMATYFTVVPNSAKEFEEEQLALQEEYEEYRENQYNNSRKYLRKMTKQELIDELDYILDYAPEWVYEDFIRRNDIDGLK